MQNKKTKLVADASALIDLNKASLLNAIFTSHFSVVVPESICAEIMSLSAKQRKLISDKGSIHILDSEMVLMATNVRNRHQTLSDNDASCIAIASSIDESILFTGDKQLRKVATIYNINVHGVLWAYDRIKNLGICAPKTLKAALQLWQDDRAVFLEAGEIDKRLKCI
ncbi:MAG: type II toxin-antitoxin system VapC family toxin [Candidatus Porifericomitaceae bacterium WSBS_2022_MAG_OTU9]